MSIFDNLAYKSTGNEWLPKVIEAVETGYEGKRRPLGIMKKNSFSPSSIGYKHNRCPRLWVMKFAGKYEEQATGTLQSLGIMNHGTNAGDRIQESFKHAGVAKHLEKEIKNVDPPIRGFIDAVIEIDGEEIIIEIKTTRTEAFRSRTLRMVGPPYQMYQILIYMYLENAKNGVLLYENTNDKRLLAVPVEMTDENRQAVEDAFEWMRLVWDAHEKGLMPARPWKQTSANCADCPLFNECWGENAPPEDIKIKSMRVHNW